MLLQFKNNNKYILKTVFCGNMNFKNYYKNMWYLKKQESIHSNTINYNLYERNLIQLFPTSKHLFLL